MTIVVWGGMLAVAAVTVACEARRAARDLRWHEERIRRESWLRAEEARAALSPVSDGRLERIDVLEVWFRLPPRVPPHEKGRA